ncbi:MAG: hypothetical protein OXF74_02560 [Rhodobacteraceae bacterium]|nr:hypothetical protein [Paracoccaceae bacterium]
MFEFLETILLGTGTGVLGTLMSFGTDFFKTRQRHAQSLELRRIDLEIAQAEAAGAERRAAIDLEADTVQAENEALIASYRQEAARLSRPGEGGAMLAVDVFRGLMRPGMTLLFLVLTGAVYFKLSADFDFLDLRERIIDTILYLTTTCTIWWFGGRQVAKSAAK